MLVTLVIHASKPETLFDHMHELGTAFYCKVKDEFKPGDETKPPTQTSIFKVVYYAANRQVYYEGPLSDDQLDILAKDYTKVQSIAYDRFKDELIVEE